MNVSITTFSNPFSFFCRLDDGDERVGLLENGSGTATRNFSKSDVSDFNHGQYVAVFWQEKWVRGVVTMESQFLIWLIDYGICLRPNEKTCVINLPVDYKKHPTKVFEASIHGISPVDKEVSEDCQIKNKVTTLWNKGAIEKAQSLIASAVKKYFVPIAVLSTMHNDIVLGDLYLKLPDVGIVNIVDELQMWPVFLEINPAAYIENLPVNYTTRRKHRASLLKPEFPDMSIPTITLEITLAEYQTVCSNAPPFDPTQYCSDKEDGSTVITKAKESFELTPAEIEKYSRMFVTVYDREYNVLNVLLNKLNDLRMCEKYKNHDLKRVGRASYHRHLVDFNDEY